MKLHYSQTDGLVVASAVEFDNHMKLHYSQTLNAELFGS